jgi:thymidylate synthase
MIDEPTKLVTPSFQDAWIAAARLLRDNGWDLRNLVVQIQYPTLFNPVVQQQVSTFAENVGVLKPKHVAYTLFPHGLAARCPSADDLFAAYNRQDGLFQRLNRKAGNRWGTYFRRMTHYDTSTDPVNQLKDILDAVRSDANTHAGAFSMIIQKPGGEMMRRRGGPCLNYIAVQMEDGDPAVLGLLCVYRSHDFLERAYGNYWGLCNLLAFMAKETGSQPGPLTCISSRAFVSQHRTQLRKFLDSLP